MAKVNMEYSDYFEYVMKRMRTNGLLLTSWKDDGSANAMTIGWGMIGIIWSRPLWQVLVRPSRYTYQLLERQPFFCVNVMPEEYNRALQICGTKSGRDYDKLSLAGITAEKGSACGAPVIKESIIHYECQIVHKNDFVPEQMVPDIREGNYPSGDFHRVYWGQIIDCKVDEQAMKTLQTS